jgi:PAS domain S-box-containing protein
MLAALSPDVAALLHDLPEPTFAVGLGKRLVDMNGAASSLLGIARDAARGRPCAEVVRCAACGDRCPLDLALEQGKTVYTPDVRLDGGHGGEAVTLLTTPLRSPAGEVVAVLESVRPAASRDDARAVLDSLGDGVITLDGDRTIVGVNRAGAQILGRAEVELVGRACWDVLGCRADTAGACPATAAVLRESRRVTNFETEYRDCAGRAVPVSLSLAPLRDRHGRARGAVEVFRDLRTPSSPVGPDVALVVGSPRMHRVMELVDVLKDSDATVLLQGESGTGKGVLAALIHRLGNRARKPFVKVNCGALPEGLLESELFGHVKGAFTGAVRDVVGRFELADGGTVFLDEVGELSPAMQVKLLRVLQEQEFERVGSTRTVHVDVRVIAATHRDLRQLMLEGGFRADLFYRLNVIPIELPPLRERREDVPALVEHILARLASKGRKVKAVAPEVMEALLAYPWPGNIRELENTLEHAVVCSKGSVIEPTALPRSVLRPTAATVVRRPGARDDQVLEVLAAHGGNLSAAARALGVDRTTVWRRLKKLGVGRDGHPA